MYRRLIEFLDKHNILIENQFGFRSGRSTTHATMLITDKIQRAIETKLYSCGIFLDLRKACDTVDHSILLAKLEHYGILGIANEWFQSYLTNRQQFVSVNNSDLKHIAYNLWGTTRLCTWPSIVSNLHQ